MRSTSPSASMRRRRPWSEGESAAGSSRKRVPRWASSKRPARSSKAPSKAPRRQPKSSRSKRVAAERGAGDLDEGLLLPRRADVDGAGDHLLLGAGLALDEDGRRGGGADGDALREGLGGRALAGNLAEVDGVALLALEVAGVVRELLAEPPVLAHRGEGGDRLPEDDGELLRVPGLLEVALDRAGVERVDEHREIRVGRQEDADRVRSPLFGPFQELDAAHPGHALIADDDRRVEPLEQVQRGLPAERVVERERLPEGEPERVQVVLFVVDDEDFERPPVEITHRGGCSRTTDSPRRTPDRRRASRRTTQPPRTAPTRAAKPPGSRCELC